MSDLRQLLVELRHHESEYASLVHGPLCGRAADEIASLRAQLEKQSTDLLAMWSDWKVRALKAEAQLASARKALEIAEDVLSRFPYSTEIWPNGVHPQRGIQQIRAALTDEERQ